MKSMMIVADSDGQDLQKMIDQNYGEDMHRVVGIVMQRFYKMLPIEIACDVYIVSD